MKNKKPDKVEKIGMIIFLGLWAVQMVVTFAIMKGGV